MPVADLPLRYRSKFGVPNGILTPPDDDAPYGLDPNYGGSQNLSTDPADIPDQANIPAPPDDATEAEQASSVELPSLSTKDKLPKRLPKPSMLPPEESEPPEAPMPATPPAPQALQPQVPPAPTLPSVELGDMDHSIATAGNPVDRSPVTPKSDDDDSATDKLGALKAPDAPSNNWAQRLGLAVLSLTRFAPIANQLMHPKYAEQRRAYETQREDLEQSQKEDIAASQAEALEEQRQATAAQKMAQAANYGQTQDTRKYAANDRLEAAFEKAMGPDAVQLGPNDQVPPGFTAFNSPSNQKWARRSPFVTVPQELAKEFPGLPPGSQITRAELDKALQSARTKDLENIKAGNKAAKPQYTGEIRAAIQANGGDPDDPNLDKGVLQKALAMVRPHNSTNVFMPPGLGPGAPQTTVVGEDYLKTLPPGTAAQIKGIAMGRAALPPMGARGQGAAIRDAVFRYDPEFSEQRAQIRKAFTTGLDGKNIGALNTAPVHLEQLDAAATALKNGSFVPGNEAYNYISKMLGAPAPTNFNTLKAAVAGELASALKGNATDTEIKTMSENLMNAQSPEQMHGAVEENLRILGKKLGTYHERYLQQIPNDTVWNPVLPSARAVFQKHGIDPTSQTPQGGGAQPVSEKALRQHAIADGQNPDLMVQRAKQRGITLVP